MLLKNFKDGQNLHQCGETGRREGGCELSPDPLTQKSSRPGKERKKSTVRALEMTRERLSLIHISEPTRPKR